jgi:hypothetical protein
VRAIVAASPASASAVWKWPEVSALTFANCEHSPKLPVHVVDVRTWSALRAELDTIVYEYRKPEPPRTTAAAAAMSAAAATASASTATVCIQQQQHQALAAIQNPLFVSACTSRIYSSCFQWQHLLVIPVAVHKGQHLELLRIMPARLYDRIYARHSVCSNRSFQYMQGNPRLQIGGEWFVETLERFYVVPAATSATATAATATTATAAATTVLAGKRPLSSSGAGTTGGGGGGGGGTKRVRK